MGWDIFFDQNPGSIIFFKKIPPPRLFNGHHLIDYACSVSYGSHVDLSTLNTPMSLLSSFGVYRARYDNEAVPLVTGSSRLVFF